jgi:2,4-dienoyl-CoA reductase-like NADH-dependent reductase (Old Yellow Enzyme family)/thioredoxin reductase
MAAYDVLFEPLTIRGVTIPNRFVSTSHAPGYSAAGRTTDRYVRYSAEKARGGVGLVQFGGATAVSVENCSYYGTLDGTSDELISDLKQMADAIHAHGSACTVQLTHGGRRERYDMDHWIPAFAPSCRRELIHRAFPAALEAHDIHRVARDYATAARRVRDGGVDGVEISCIPPGMIGQFWSPLTNVRTDEYGGSLENRMRFGLEVLEQTRLEVGDGYVVGMRMTADEMKEEGLDNEDCVEIARAYAATGLVDYVSVVGGHSSDYRSTHEMYPTMYVPSAPYLKMAAAVKEKIDLPVLHATRITDVATAAYAVEQGFIDLVGMTRAFIADPHHVRKLREGRAEDIRPCVGASYCTDRLSIGLDAVCLHNAATGREEHLSHEIEPTAGARKKVVVVGGGPGGLEAARVAASRGHEVTLIEAAAVLGGQLVLAAKVKWRRDLSGITQWLAAQLSSLNVNVQLNQLAEPGDVTALDPDVVIIATGGLPVVGHFRGAELAVSTWDVLAGQVQPGKDVLVCDETGTHSAMACAAAVAGTGATVELVTPDRTHGAELGAINIAPHMTELYRHGVELTVDARLIEVRRSGSKLVAVLSNTYVDEVEERTVDQVIGDYGTVPNDELYEALKPGSKNLGELDIEALSRFAPQTLDTNAAGSYFLYRIGDAWASRNVHAAMLDAARICKDL